jgi:hypothetical protein
MLDHTISPWTCAWTDRDRTTTQTLSAGMRSTTCLSSASSRCQDEPGLTLATHTTQMLSPALATVHRSNGLRGVMRMTGPKDSVEVWQCWQISRTIYHAYSSLFYGKLLACRCTHAAALLRLPLRPISKASLSLTHGSKPRYTIMTR